MAKYTPINWDEIKKNKVELPKFANAAERTAYLEELYKDADLMEDDGKILRRESRSYALQDYYASMTDEEKAIYSENARLRAQEPDYQQNHQAGIDKRSDNIDWRVNVGEANRLKVQTPEFIEKMKIAHENPEFIEKMSVISKEKWKDPAFREKRKISHEIMRQSPTYKQNHLLANQKANSKAISCNGVIYPSRTAAALVLAPATRSSNVSKSRWVDEQLKKYPDRFFYV